MDLEISGLWSDDQVFKSEWTIHDVLDADEDILFSQHHEELEPEGRSRNAFLELHHWKESWNL